MKKILFVCTGNTCRSPMAAGIMNMLLKKHGLSGFEAISAGLAARDGSGASENAVRACAEIGVDLSGHSASCADANVLKESFKIYAMTNSHKQFLESAYPDCKGKIYVLGGEIPDPYGGGPGEYKNCRDMILKALDSVVVDLAKTDES